MNGSPPPAPEPRLGPGPGPGKVLDRRQLDAFRRDGFVRLPRAFDPELALTLQAEVWDELARDQGVDRHDPTTWSRLRRSPGGAKTLALNERVASDRFLGAISDLVGSEDWERPRTWGGFLVTFPRPAGTSWKLPTDGWHWDGPPDARGLLIFSFYSNVAPTGGGTLLVRGSHRVVERFYASLSPSERARPHRDHRKLLSRWTPWLAELTGRSHDPGLDRSAAFMDRDSDVRGVPCRVVELTGEPGDAVFCNLGILHSAAPNCREEPRVMRSKFLTLTEADRLVPRKPQRRPRPGL